MRTAASRGRMRMRTDQLIRAIVTDVQKTRPVEMALPLALLASAAIVGALFLMLVGPRSDPGVVVRSVALMTKQIFPVILAIGAFGAVVRLARPAARVGGWSAVLAVVPLVLLTAAVAELMQKPEQDWYTGLVGQTLWFCLSVIPLMSLPILAVSLWVLQRGASTRPTLSGAVAGLMSGGTATAIYAIHCTEDSPLFYATWYSLAILLVAALGAAFGSHVLRW